MSSVLVYGEVTERGYSGMHTYYVINDNITVYTPTGSLVDRAVHTDKIGFFAINKSNIIEDYEATNHGRDSVTITVSKMQALNMATNRMIAAHKKLSDNDKALVMNALGLTLGGLGLIGGVITATTSLATGDFTGTLGGAVTGAIGGAFAYFSYDSMTKCMKLAYDTTQTFKTALDTYHARIESIAPERMKMMPVYNPHFPMISKLLRTVFPHFGEENLQYNQPNWALA